MRKRKVVELLNEHAESLQDGQANGEALLARHPERQGALKGLFDLAERVRKTLAPVEPPPTFITDLKRLLIENAQHARLVARRERERRAVVIAASAGGAVYLLGLLALMVRSAVSIVGVVLALFGWRRLRGNNAR